MAWRRARAAYSDRIGNARGAPGSLLGPLLNSTIYDWEPDRLRRSFNSFILVLRPNLAFFILKFGRKMYNYKDTLLTARFLRTEMDKQPLRHILNSQPSSEHRVSSKVLSIEGYYSINIFIQNRNNLPEVMNWQNTKPFNFWNIFVKP